MSDSSDSSPLVTKEAMGTIFECAKTLQECYVEWFGMVRHGVEKIQPFTIRHHLQVCCALREYARNHN